MSRIYVTCTVLLLLQLLRHVNPKPIPINSCHTKVDNDGKTIVSILDTGLCNFSPMAVPRNGFKLDLYVPPSTKFGTIGFIDFMFVNSIDSVSLYIEKNFNEYNVYKNDGELLGVTTESRITIEVDSDGKGYVVPRNRDSTFIAFPSLKDLPMEKTDMAALNLGLNWRDVVSRVELQFQPEVKIMHQSASSTTTTETTTTTSSASATTTSTAIDPTAEKSDATTAIPGNYDTSEKTPVFKQAWFIVLAVLIGLVLLIGVIAMAVVGVKLRRRHRKSRASSTPHPNARSHDTPDDIHINIDGYDLFVPGHPNERAEFRAADREKKGQMLDDFLGRRSQS